MENHLIVEWKRLDTLGRLALASRQGHEPAPELLAELRSIHDEVGRASCRERV